MLRSACQENSVGTVAARHHVAHEFSRMKHRGVIIDKNPHAKLSEWGASLTSYCHSMGTVESITFQIRGRSYSIDHRPTQEGK